MKQTITLTEALSKLKLYDKKIRKELNTLGNLGNEESLVDYVVGVVNDKAKGTITRKTVEELKVSSTAKIQKIKDLINNRNKLKALVSQVNATTTLKIMDKEYTIVQAIERKLGIVNEKKLVDELETQLTSVKNKVSYINERAQDKANQIVESQVQGESKNKKTEEIEALYNLIYDKNKAEVIDPAKIEDLVTELREDIDTFEQNVDVALSIVNAKTEIEIDF